MIENKLKLKQIDLKSKYDNFFMISDIHIGVRMGSEEWIENIKDYFYNWFIPLLKEHKTDKSALFVLGDIFDDRKSINIMANDFAISLFEDISKIIPIIAITGNHDIYKKSDNSITSLRSFDNIKNLTIIKDPTIIKLCGKKLIFVPYQGDIEKETDIIVQNCKCDYFFLHTDIRSLHYDNGRDITSGVDLTTVKNGKIYSGHIHRREESKLVTYIGSPYQLRRSDIGNDKCIYHVDIVSGKETKYFNRHSPVFQKIRLNNILDMTYQTVLSIFSNNYTDIIVNDEELSKLDITQLYNSLEPCKPKRIEIKVINETGLLSNINDASIDYKVQSIDEIIDSIIDNMDIADEKKEKLKILSEKYQNIIKAEE